MDPLAATADSAVRRIGLPLYQGRGWIKFVGILSIISGVASALTLVGIVIAWLPIWMGVLLVQAASLIERAYAGNDEQALTESFAKLKIYFVITGVLALVGIVFTVLGLFAAILIPALLSMN